MTAEQPLIWTKARMIISSQPNTAVEIEIELPYLPKNNIFQLRQFSYLAANHVLQDQEMYHVPAWWLMGS